MAANQYNDGGARERYADLLQVFAEAAIPVEDSASQRKLARLASKAKAPGQSTCRLLDGDTVIPDAEKALITVCVKPPTGRQKNPRGLIIQRDVVAHPYLRSERNKTWYGVRIAEYPTVKAAFEAWEELHLAAQAVWEGSNEAEEDDEVDFDSFLA